MYPPILLFIPHDQNKGKFGQKISRVVHNAGHGGTNNKMGGTNNSRLKETPINLLTMYKGDRLS